jgi:hypothetical protein
MPADPDLRAVLRAPFAEQIAFFRGKLGHLLPTERWDDIQRSQHDRAFMVAGAARADLLSDLAAAVDKAIADGESLERFRVRFGELVERRGWQGWTGSQSEAGRAWRTRVIYVTNASTSYAAGRLAQLKEAGFPLWVYRHGGSREPRPQHLAWDGLTLPADHPFWEQHYPPNGWGCSCYVLGARDARAARRLGGDPDKPLDAGWQRHDPRTGEPVGIDRGWGYMPGASVAEEIAQAVAAKTVAWPYEIAKAYMSTVPAHLRDALATAQRQQPETGEALRRYAERVLGVRRGEPLAGPLEVAPYQTTGLLTRSEAERIASLTGIAAIRRELWDWTVNASAIRHVEREHGDAAIENARGQIAVRVDDYALLPTIIAQAQEPIGTGRSGIGNPVVQIEGTVSGVRYTATFAALSGRRMLTLQSLWKRAAPPR